VQGLDDAHAAFEFLGELADQRLIESAVELDRGQAGLVNNRCDLPRVAGVEDTDALDAGRKVRRNRGHLRRRNLARAGGKNEADGVGAKLCGELGVFEVCVAADLYPHGIDSFGRTQPHILEMIQALLLKI
jgi:hypothetical protein